MKLIPRFFRPVRWLKYTSARRDEHNPDFTVGEIRSLRWQMWWMRYLPYRLYPIMPFEKVVNWHWGKHALKLPRPWAKDPMADFGPED